MQAIISGDFAFPSEQMAEPFLQGLCVFFGDCGQVAGLGSFSPWFNFATRTFLWAKNGVFWDVTPCGSCENRRFGGT
jgi:hypothetical protein